MTESKETLRKLADQSTHLRVSGILLLGNLNAPHETWGDHNHNKAGESLLAFNREMGLEVIYLHDEPSFICDNGSCYIDLICSNDIARIQNQYTDSSMELFTRAPYRGHLPVITELFADQSSTNSHLHYKWDKADWTGFCETLESICQKQLTAVTTAKDPDSIRHILTCILSQCKKEHVLTTTSNPHNKPYWNEELSSLSKKPAYS